MNKVATSGEFAELFRIIFGQPGLPPLERKDFIREGSLVFLARWLPATCFKLLLVAVLTHMVRSGADSEDGATALLAILLLVLVIAAHCAFVLPYLRVLHRRLLGIGAHFPRLLVGLVAINAFLPFFLGNWAGELMELLVWAGIYLALVPWSDGPAAQRPAAPPPPWLLAVQEWSGLTLRVLFGAPGLPPLDRRGFVREALWVFFVRGGILFVLGLCLEPIVMPLIDKNSLGRGASLALLGGGIFFICSYGIPYFRVMHRRLLRIGCPFPDRLVAAAVLAVVSVHIVLPYEDEWFWYSQTIYLLVEMGIYLALLPWPEHSPEEGQGSTGT